MNSADMTKRFWSKVDLTVGPHDCWNWLIFKDKDGYGRFQVSKKVSRFAHRISWQIERGPIPEGLCVLHKCDNPSCVNPDHLFLGTRLDNNRDRHLKGRDGPRAQLFGDDNPSRRYPQRLSRGESHPNAKITADIVRLIRSSPKTGQALAGELNLDKGHVCKIRRGALWAHIS